MRLLLLGAIAAVGVGLVAFVGGAAAAPKKLVKGKSGRHWTTQILFTTDRGTLVQINEPELSTMVIQYVQAKDGRRFLAAAAPTVLVTSAMSDFNVQGPVGVPKPGTAPPPNPSPAVPVGKIRVEQGATYEANISIGFPASLIASEGLLRDGIAKEGFSRVFVSDERPAGWGIAGDADYFVRATWTNPPKLFDRPKALDNFRRLA